MNYVKLKGDASGRQYFRGDGHIKAVYPEIMRESFKNFIFWQSVYNKHSIRVPEIIDADENSLTMFLEDCGNIDGVHYLHNMTEDRKLFFSHKVFNIISSIKHLPVNQSSLSEIDINYELDFLLEHLDGTLLQSIPDTIIIICNSVRDAMQDINYELAHRDYHFRNIMVKNDEIIVIDFQDTRLAPEYYDEVSLLYDCYFDLKEIRERVFSSTSDRLFRLTALQRNLKALGTFCYFGYKKNKPWFKESIPLTLSHIRSHLESLNWSDLKKEWDQIFNF